MLGRMDLIHKLGDFESQLEDLPGTGRELITATISYLQRNYNHDEVMQGCSKTIRLAFYELVQQLAALNIEKFLLWANRSNPAFLLYSRDGWMKLHLEECHIVRRLREDLNACQSCASSEGLACEDCERKIQ